MYKNSRLVLAVALIVSAVLFSGCYSAYRAARDERDLDTQASDAKMATNIKYALMQDDSVSGLSISASVYYGTAYLVGIVENNHQKNVAIAHARAEAGVKSVKTYLVTQNDKTMGESVDDTAIATKVRANMIGDKNMSSSQIKIKSVLGHVVLMGVVDDPQDRDRAIAHAKAVKGVKNVKSFIVME